MELDAKVPAGSIQEKWDQHRFDMKLVNPNNKRRFTVIIIGTGLAGASAAATLGELGYQVKAFTFHDSARRAHSIAAQGGINAAKNYRNDGDSVYRLFYDTVKGGDYRSREANVYRLAQVSNEIIDQCAAQGVPFAREYGGLLDNRSFGGAQVSRTFYARGQTGQQLLLGAYQAMEHQVQTGAVQLYNRSEMLDIVTVDGRAVGVVVRDLLTGEVTSHAGHAVVLATGGYSNVFYLSTNAKNSNVTAIWRAHRKGALFANPCYTQIHPTCIPQSDEHQSKLTLMSESLRNDGRIWVPVNPDDDRSPEQIPLDERDYYLERRYPAFGNLVPRDVASRNAKMMIDEGKGVGERHNGVYLDFYNAIDRLGQGAIGSRYGNLFEMYERITGENPYQAPMRIYPAPHYTMGGLWVDYNLSTTIPGLYAIGEANFSDHGANRLGASALMQGLADGYFVLPYTIGDYLAPLLGEQLLPADHEAFGEAEADVRGRVEGMLAVRGTRSVDWFHRELGKIMWDYCGMARSRPGLEKALSEIPALREEFLTDVRVLGENESLNQSLEKAGRVADFFELAELMCVDALHREESCGGHFREEHQTEEGEALRDDDGFSYVAAWEFGGRGRSATLHKEDLHFEYVKLAQRSYK
ncbi:MAG: fumarate reductase/succinate dehydrogenase flavoprotein subunit [Actinomycetota bacterium]|jgi:succinate dehydrogenase / fumarate reductase flavoprotein subunit|nr:fumarate reductase/succinate dehydrogenase flavoprotein subunit [Actinomycetota bacterium]